MQEYADLDSPVLDPKIGSATLLGDGDDSALLSLAEGPGSLGDMSLGASPTMKVQSSKKVLAEHSRPKSKETRSRPSWGPKPSPKRNSNIRLLEGLESKRPERTLGTMSYGNKQRARQSIFARPQVQEVPSSPHDGTPLKGEGDDSFYKNRELASSTGSVKDRVAAIEHTLVQGGGAESADELDAQLDELRKLNTIFESYESVLRSSAEQVDVSKRRIMVGF